MCTYLYNKSFYYWWVVAEQVQSYRIVPGKHPWALAAQAPKLRVGGYTKEVLEWSNYLCASAHPGCNVSCQGILLHRCFTRASSRPAWWKTLYHAIKADWPIASLPSVRNVRHLQYMNLVPQTKNATNKATNSVCERLMLDVVQDNPRAATANTAIQGYSYTLQLLSTFSLLASCNQLKFPTW